MKWLIFLLTLLLPINVMATEYHVATDGSGDYTTVAGANVVAVSGDTVSLNKGDTFNEIVTVVSGVTYNSYGSGDKPIISRLNSVLGQVNWSIDGINIKQNAWGGAINIVGGNNITLSNLLVEDLGFGGAKQLLSIEGSDTYGWAYDITITDSTFKDGLNTSNVSIRQQCRNITVRDCISYNSGDNNYQIYNSDATRRDSYAPHDITIRDCEGYSATNHGVEVGWDIYDCIVERCYLHDNGINFWDNGLMFADTGENNIVRNNIFFNNYSQITLQDDVGSHTNNNKVYNNTFISSGNRGVWIRSGGNSNIIKNNIFYNTSDVYNIIVASGKSLISDYNNYNSLKFDYQGTNYTTLSSWQSATSQDLHSISADPLLNSDYTLKAGSPCIDSGVYLADVLTDYNGRIRGSTPDIGALQYSMMPKDIVDLEYQKFDPAGAVNGVIVE